MKNVAFFLFSVFVVSARADYPMAIVSHRWQEVITESNHASLRPGSVYDIHTYFEQNFGLKRPTFNYLFFDTGLGATDPIYTIFQSGYQYSWSQLIKAGTNENIRHIDHFSQSETPEGCLIKSNYWVRHVNEFPDMYQKLRADGYTLVDISFDYYVKLRPDAQCGKHVAHEMGEDFDPFGEIYKYAGKFKTLADIPPELLKKYEAKIGILKLVTEEFSKTKWPRYKDSYSKKANSLYFYPDAFDFDYGINASRPQKDLGTLNHASQFVLPATPALQQTFDLKSAIGDEAWNKLWRFWNGKPTPDYNPATEPGDDAFSLSQVTPTHLYTDGTNIESIKDVFADVGDPKHFKLVSAVVRPAEPETDVHFQGTERIPQIRLVYQLMNPRDLSKPTEQLFIHAIYDAVDRLAPARTRDGQAAEFLRRLDQLSATREHASLLQADAETHQFLRDYTSRPAETISFSSSLTGIWVFGQLSRSYNAQRELLAVPITRAGINVGYYSTVYDTVLFRAAAKTAASPQKETLDQILDDLTPRFYRDPRRHDASAITFQRVTCAQCHQTSGRDGVHIAFNDGLDRRITTPVRATEILFRELDLQLQALPSFKK